MSERLRELIQELMSAEQSPHCDELLRLGFDALAGVPLRELASAAALAPLIHAALAHDNSARVADRHVLPGIARVTSGLHEARERVRDTLSARAEQRLRAIVHGGRGPRFAWLKGAFAPEDVRDLLAPVIQQMLLQFAQRLPLAGLLAGPGGGAISGIVGRIGKQVQKSAGTVADVGRSVISGLSADLERKLQGVARDFSQTATAEFRTALAARLRTPEGAAIAQRMRDRVVEHVLGTRLDEIAQDLLRLPREEVAALTHEVLDHLRDQPLFRQLLEQEITATLSALEARSFADVLHEAGLLDQARSLATAAVSPGLRSLVASEPFGAWLDRLLQDAG